MYCQELNQSQNQREDQLRKLNLKPEALLGKRLSEENILYEDLLRDTNTGLSTGAVATFIMSGFQPQLIQENIIQVVLENLDGMDSVTVPISAGLTAGEVNNAGVIAIQTSVDYGSADINFSLYAVYNGIAFELLRHANMDVIGHELQKMGWALGRYADGLILTAFNTATTALLENYTPLGLGNLMDWDHIWTEVKAMLKLGLRPRVILTNPEIWTRLITASPIVPHYGDPIADYPFSTNIGGFRVIASDLVDDNTCYIIDRDNCGYLYREPVSSFTMRASGFLVEEMFAKLRMGVTVVQEESVYRIKEDTAA